MAVGAAAASVAAGLALKKKNRGVRHKPRKTKLLNVLKVLNKIGNIVISGSSAGRLELRLELGQVGRVEVLATELAEDVRQDLLHGLLLSGSRHDVGVSLDGGLDCSDGSAHGHAHGRTLQGVAREVDDLAVVLEEGDLLDTLDGLAAEALEVGLELLVVAGSALVLDLVLPAGGTLATNAHVCLQLLELISVHPAHCTASIGDIRRINIATGNHSPSCEDWRVKRKGLPIAAMKRWLSTKTLEHVENSMRRSIRGKSRGAHRAGLRKRPP